METNTNGQLDRLQKFLRLKEVEELVGLKRSSIYNKMQDGTFPTCIRLSTRAVAWRESDIAAWQASKGTEQAGQQ